MISYTSFFLLFFQLPNINYNGSVIKQEQSTEQSIGVMIHMRNLVDLEYRIMLDHLQKIVEHP